MKPIKCVRVFYRNIKAIKYRIILSLIIIVLLMTLIGLDYIKTKPQNINLSVFDILCHVSGFTGFTGILALIFPIVPIYTFLLISLIEHENSSLFLLRSPSRIYIWRMRICFSFLLAIIFSVLIVFGGYIIAGSLLGSFKNNWSSADSFVYSIAGQLKEWPSLVNSFKTYKILPIVFLSNLLGLTAVGVLISTLKVYFKNTYVYMVIIIVILLDGLMNKFSLILKQMTIDLSSYLNPDTIIINDIYFLLLITALYLMGKRAIDKKDIIKGI